MISRWIDHLICRMFHEEDHVVWISMAKVHTACERCGCIRITDHN